MAPANVTQQDTPCNTQAYSALTAHKQGNRYYGRATITILGSPSGNPAADANVSITWSGAVSGSASATTDSSGNVTFTSAKVSQNGPFTITVNNVTHATITYIPALNVETSDTVSF